MANTAGFLVDPVHTALRSRIDAAPSVFGDAPDVIAGKTRSGIIGLELRPGSVRIVDPRQSGAGGHPHPPSMIEEEGLHHASGKSVLCLKHTEMAVVVSRQVVPIEAHPHAAGTVLRKRRRGAKRPAVISLLETLKPVLSARPPRGHFRANYRDPHVAARVLIDSEDFLSRKTVLLCVDLLRHRVGQLFHALYLGVSAQAARGCYPPDSRMILHMNLARSPGEGVDPLGD